MRSRRRRRSAAVLAALALAAIPLAAAGAPLGRAFALMAAGAAGSLFALTETLTRATPLIFTGLAAAVAFRARLYNIGAEGQLYARRARRRRGRHRRRRGAAPSCSCR